MSQINGAINQISQAVQQNAAAAEELASTSEEVNAQSLELQSMMAFFTLPGGQDQGGGPGLRPVAQIRGQIGSLAPRTPGKVQSGDFTRF